MKKVLLFSFMIMLTGMVWAQDKSISGVVTSAEDGMGIPGASVILKGTQIGVVTDIDGNYRLTVPSTGGVLVFSFIGLQSQEITIGNQSTINVELSEDVTQLNEVVVTALNVEREKKTLGYATQEVGAENLRVARETNLNEALAGKVAGVQVISGSGAKFGEAAVRIRGVRGFGSNAPLYVVDGIPTSDPSTINMDNVESINVLKGANASALYGSRARDGVILITMKKAKGGRLNIDFNNTTTFENVSVMPKYQNQYGGGYSQEWQTFSYDASKDDPALAGLDGAKIPEFYADESWGPRLDGSQVAQWDAFTPGTDTYGQTRAWSPNPNNVKDFFNTGVGVQNSLSVSKAGEGYNITATMTNVNRTGVLPNTKQDKTFLNLNASVDLAKNLKLNTLANYNRTNVFGNLTEGYQGSVGQNFNQWFQRQLDMSLLEKYYRMPDGRYTSWNINSPRNSTPLYWNNPYTEQYANFSESTKDTYSGKFGLTYEIIDGLSVSANISRYFTSNFADGRTASGTLGLDGYSQSKYQSTEDNYEFLAQYSKVTEKFSVSALVGGNIRHNNYSSNSMSTAGGLSVPDLYNISASINRPNTSNYTSKRQVNSIFAQASFGYKEIVFVDGSIRRDYDSVLPTASNAFTYPAISTSFIFSELMPNNRILSFGKIRAGYAEVGGELSPYQLDPAYSLGTPYNGNPTMTYPNSLIDPNLRAATTGALEAGFELAFLQGRIRTEFSYYYYDNTNEILATEVPSTTGISSYTINAGKTFTKGWDATIGGTPVQTANFNWDLNFNFARSRNVIEEIYPGIDAIQLVNGFLGNRVGGGWGSISARAKVGEDWGTIIGEKYQRDEAGNILIDEDGYPMTEQNQVLGTILPDYTGGIFNRFTYKDFELSFTIDWQIGGKVNSISNMFNAYSGLGTMTVGNNDKGVPMRDPVADGGGLRFEGVYADGTENDIYLEADTYWKSLFALHEQWVYDASYVKLREVRFGYNLPQSLLQRTKLFRSAAVAVVANNPWLIKTNVPGFDPSQVSGDTRNSRNNGSWVDSGQLPATRSIGFDIRLGF
ncbi:SusC/RagA family TonB-linked outer membrane protein [Algoriphagus zhangzhouensis]|uniref:TonB-linked outer membrane protein, SusC/RagA family n=1 Tax=Algoriphagus zhangzhouensis TaxID=1073327 RepID=A0A1M7ZJZ2_9BACT|nr:SusC/RagA family TonB-linked outer membrane protein [Algoriphagus zhangzhouensis]TDY43112.1 TonB-linked SusC/RagA family outer membrane protein [Algoriphagus zhangzhouensis]SHO65224.1 TonB-linked outer membrane protein, SusC/RagA family [Algoriphagus zhangzhouensis]